MLRNWTPIAASKKHLPKVRTHGSATMSGLRNSQRRHVVGFFFAVALDVLTAVVTCGLPIVVGRSAWF